MTYSPLLILFWMKKSPTTVFQMVNSIDKLLLDVKSTTEIQDL